MERHFFHLSMGFMKIVHWIAKDLNLASFASLTNLCVMNSPLKYKVRKGMMAEVIYLAKVGIKESPVGDL